MKRTILIALLLTALLTALLTGCTRTPAAPTTEPVVTTKPLETTPAPETTAVPTETEVPTTEDPNLFRFTRENFPRLDGSTACIPLGEAVCSVLLGEDREAVQDLVQFNRTTQSFRNLMYGDCDLILASQPNAAVFDEMKENGFEYDMEQIATDALVFMVNEENPVEGITTEQLRDIYTGKITNWKELGGNDAPIVPLQRNEGAGSQALMKKLVMKDTELMEAPKEYVPESMAGLIETVKSYDASANAIGYTVYYYANDMEMARGLKLLKIDGVEPCKDSIRTAEYPHLNPYYCVIAHDAPADSPIRILYDWLMTEDGQRLLDAEGYVTNP